MRAYVFLCYVITRWSHSRENVITNLRRDHSQRMWSSQILACHRCDHVLFCDHSVVTKYFYWGLRESRACYVCYQSILLLTAKTIYIQLHFLLIFRYFISYNLSFFRDKIEKKLTWLVVDSTRGWLEVGSWLEVDLGSKSSLNAIHVRYSNYAARRSTNTVGFSRRFQWTISSVVTWSNKEEPLQFWHI